MGAIVQRDLAYSFQPKNLLVSPKSFGRRVDALWNPYNESDPVEVAKVTGAYLQHLAACETTRIAFEKGWSLAELHAKMGDREKPNTLRRKLYGTAPATFTDLGAWMAAVGRKSVVAVLVGDPEGKEPLKPPTQETNGDESEGPSQNDAP